MYLLIAFIAFHLFLTCPREKLPKDSAASDNESMRFTVFFINPPKTLKTFLDFFYKFECSVESAPFKGNNPPQNAAKNHVFSTFFAKGAFYSYCAFTSILYFFFIFVKAFYSGIKKFRNLEEKIFLRA